MKKSLLVPVVIGILGYIVFAIIQSAPDKKQPSTLTNSYIEKETTNKSIVVDPFARIENASPVQLNHIKYALNHGYNIKEMYVVKSRDFDNVYFAGALVNNKIAIWAIGGTKSRISLTMSMNNYAYKVSGLGMGSSLREPMTLADDGCGLLMQYFASK